MTRQVQAFTELFTRWYGDVIEEILEVLDDKQPDDHEGAVEEPEQDDQQPDDHEGSVEDLEQSC